MTSSASSSSSQRLWLLGATTAAATAGIVLLTRAWKKKRSNHEDDVDPLLGSLSKKGQREVAKKLKLKEKNDESIPSNGGTKYYVDDDGGIPPGNFSTPKWLVTDLGIVPKEEKDADWNFQLTYKDHTVTVSMKDVLPLLERMEGECAWHCVTGWTKRGLIFWGVPMKKVLALLLLPNSNSNLTWTWAFQVSADGYTCPIHRQDLESDQSYLILKVQQQQQAPNASNSSSTATAAAENTTMISWAHGGPRIYIPYLWGWKSAKWMTRLELLDEYRPGFWENIVCHARGRVYDPHSKLYLQERWASGYGIISDFLTGIVNLFHLLPYGPQLYQFAMTWGGVAVQKIQFPLQSITAGTTKKS